MTEVMAEVMTKARTKVMTKARTEQVLSLRTFISVILFLLTMHHGVENDDTLSDISFSKNTKI
jgi:hypothetical protein